MAQIEINKPLDGVTIEVECRLTALFWVRLWLGKLLLVMACRVLGCGIEFKDIDG